MQRKVDFYAKRCARPYLRLRNEHQSLAKNSQDLNLGAQGPGSFSQLVPCRVPHQTTRILLTVQYLATLIVQYLNAYFSMVPTYLNLLQSTRRLISRIVTWVRPQFPPMRHYSQASSLLLIAKSDVVRCSMFDAVVAVLARDRRCRP